MQPKASCDVEKIEICGDRCWEARMQSKMDREASIMDEEIRSRASEDKDVKLLLTMTGIDIYTALLIRSEIGSIDRFADYKKLGSWAGLPPSIREHRV